MSVEDYVNEDFDCEGYITEREPRSAEIQSVDRETPKAWLVTINGEQHWLPKSQCIVRRGFVEMPAWLFSAKGIKG